MGSLSRPAQVHRVALAHRSLPATNHDLVRYYGITGSPLAFKFDEYLRTRGLRRYDGAAKAGYPGVVAALKARGW